MCCYAPISMINVHKCIIPSKIITQSIFCNPTYQCSLNSLTQLLISSLRIINYNYQFNSSTKLPLSNCTLEPAHSASNSIDVDAFKFRIVQYIFYNGQIQQYSSECLMMLIEVISKGSVPNCWSTDNISTRDSLSYIFIYFRTVYCLRYMWNEISSIWV